MKRLRDESFLLVIEVEKDMVGDVDGVPRMGRSSDRRYGDGTHTAIIRVLSKDTNSAVVSAKTLVNTKSEKFNVDQT